jgi:hypothetical protein
MLGGQGGACVCGHDEINLERDQFGHESGEPLKLPFGRSVPSSDINLCFGTDRTEP